MPKGDPIAKRSCGRYTSHRVEGDIDVLARNDHLVDAAVCVLAGQDFLTDRAIGPEPGDMLAQAQREGWIWAA